MAAKFRKMKEEMPALLQGPHLQKWAFVLPCLGNIPRRRQPGRISCRICKMPVDDDSSDAYMVRYVLLPWRAGKGST